ncbi:Holliday junction resolvase RecU [Shouchella patagoniensis]|uniref:Holliday junction resolvase RecU n=1 Tax=Shouchella patagoniensis TaxID=228576 RepID=UPI0009955BC5|nr:Holliday junction resolvase RecU [Shouchella patagoniensis]
MAIRYPNGKSYVGGEKEQKQKKLPADAYSGRGMTLEQDLDETNLYYLSRHKAVIHKKPTPVQIVKVDYPKRSAAVIREAYFKQASTTDYNGVYNGRYLDFEAKETKNKTSFPLKNIHDHQIEHMRNVRAQKGICFVLIRFFVSKEVFLLDASHIIAYYDQQNTRKSIKKTDIERLGHLVHTGFHPRIDYLETVERIYFQSSIKGEKLDGR